MVDISGPQLAGAAISCVGPRYCVAVGTRGAVPFAEAWDGRSWKLTTLANPGKVSGTESWLPDSGWTRSKATASDSHVRDRKSAELESPGRGLADAYFVVVYS